MFVFVSNVTSSQNDVKNIYIRPIQRIGRFNMDIFDSSINVLNKATYIDRQDIIEAVRLAQLKYGKAFDKLAAEG